MIARGIGQHFFLSLRLILRSKQSLLYGYFVPFLFLIAYGSLFRTDQPMLWNEMGQLLCLTILGGVCFGLPTTLVAERERGVWKRYQLLPCPLSALVLSTVAARVVILYSSLILQIALARLLYGTPFPEHWIVLTFCLGAVILSFSGLGWLIAALANDIPAVQALGQSIFLPMVMIGGVGVPLQALPGWARTFAAFLPGRYGVEILQSAYTEENGWRGSGFALLSLAVIGVSAAVAGARLFRTERGARLPRSSWGWIMGALSAWLIVGLAAIATRRIEPKGPGASTYGAVTARQMDEITYDDLTSDNEMVTRLAPPFHGAEKSARLTEIEETLKTWPPGQAADPAQRVRNFLALAAVADLGQDLLEGEIARAILDHLVATIPAKTLRQTLAWVILEPNEGTVIRTAPEFGLRKHPAEPFVRERSVYYAKKYLGRLLGKLRN